MVKKLFFILIAVVFVLSCATTQQSNSSGMFQLDGIYGNEWKLIEVRINNVNTEFDRNTLIRDGYGNIFTFIITADSISGVGAPNRFSAPYTISSEDPQAVTIAVVRSTLMASIYSPEKLREHDFFTYIQNTYKWELSGENLVLHSRTQNGADVTMVFNL